MKTLLQRTVELLEARPRSLTLAKLSEKTGATISWIASLTSDSPPKGPSVNKVEKLYNALSETPLFTEVNSNESSTHTA